MPGLVTAQDKSNSTGANLRPKAQAAARGPPAKGRPPIPPRPSPIMPPPRPASGSSPAPAKTKPLVIVKKPSVSSISAPPSSFSSSIVVVSLADTKPLATQKSKKNLHSSSPLTTTNPPVTAKPPTTSKPASVIPKTTVNKSANPPVTAKPPTASKPASVTPTTTVNKPASSRPAITPPSSSSTSIVSPAISQPAKPVSVVADKTSARATQTPLKSTSAAPPASSSFSTTIVSPTNSEPAKPLSVVPDAKSTSAVPPASSSYLTIVVSPTNSQPAKPVSVVPKAISTQANQAPVKSTSAVPPASSLYPSIIVSSPEGTPLDAQAPPATKAAPDTTSVEDTKPSAATTPPTIQHTLVWNHLTHPDGPHTANGPPSVLPAEADTVDRSVHPTNEMMKCRSYKLLRKNAPPPLVQFAASSNGPRAIPSRKGGTAPYALPPDHRAAPPTPIPEEIDAVSAASTEIPDDESNHSHDSNIDSSDISLKRSFPSIFQVHRLLQNAEHPDQFRALVNQFLVLVDQVADIIETFPKSDNESDVMKYEVHRYGVSFISDSLRSTMEFIYSGKLEYVAGQLHNPMNLSQTLLDYLEKYYIFAHPCPALVTSKELPPLPSTTTGSDEGHTSSSDTASICPSTKSSKSRKFWPSPKKTLRSLGGSKTSLFTLRSKASTNKFPVLPEPAPKPAIDFEDFGKENKTTLFYQPRQSAIYFPSDPLYPKFDVEMPVLSGEAAALTADENGNIKSGTLCALVHILTSNGCHVGSSFYNTFFVGFRLFSSPLQFFNELMRRYEQPLPLEERNLAQQRVAEREKVLIRTRVAKVVFDWLHSHWVPEEDDKVLDCMAQFLEKATKDGVLPQGTIDRLKLEVQKRQNGDYRIPEHKQLVRPPLIESVPECNVADFDFPDAEYYKTGSVYEHLMKFNTPLGRKEFAKQITARCSELFCSLKPLEDLVKLWVAEHKNLTDQKPIDEMKNRFRVFLQFQSGVMLWVTDSILRQKDSAGRVHFIVFWLEVAGICYDHRDYYAFQTIFSGVAASPITRMRETVMQVPVERKLQYWKYIELLAQYKSTYKSLMRDALPMVPNMVDHSQQFKKEQEKAEKVTDPEDDRQVYKLIKLEQYERMEMTIQELSQCLPFHFPKEINFQAWFLQQIEPFAELTVRDLRESTEMIQTYCSEEQDKQYIYSETVEPRSEKFSGLQTTAWHYALDEKGNLVKSFPVGSSSDSARKTRLIGTLIRSLKKSDAKKPVEPTVGYNPPNVGDVEI